MLKELAALNVNMKLKAMVEVQYPEILFILMLILLVA